MRLLQNTHISPETAYVVEDYPYGFRPRRKIRYWLDAHPKGGARLMSRTSNPKLPGPVWNKPKVSTYALFGGAMYLDDEGHAQWAAPREYISAAERVAWRDTYGPAVPAAIRNRMNAWIAAKVAYEARKEGSTR